MMKCRRTWLCGVVLCWYLFLLLSLNSCDEHKSPSSSEQDKPLASSEMVTDPGQGNLAGTVVGTIANQPLTGVSLKIGSLRTTTDNYGNFRLDGVGNEQCILNISSDQVYPRRIIVNLANGRVIQADAIERQSAFHLEFYRELARGNHPGENDLLPIHRWTGAMPPTFYIDTNARAAYDGVITSETIDRITQVITEVVPVFSGNVYAEAAIYARSFSEYAFETIPDNSIVISFDDTLFLQDAVGIAFTEPNLTSLGSYALQKAWIFVLNQEAFFSFSGVTREAVVAHELGHSFGYRHTSLLPSIMVKAGMYAGLFSENDRVHMAVMYRRPAGNMDIDNDPITTEKTVKRILKHQVFLDRCPDISSSPFMKQRLRSLKSSAAELFEKTSSSAIVSE
ncbi:hypothetical protein U27_01304 [Candidatus Vecturithrix granuli]|uniref:Peptidase M10 metallopeptidase domain-containing protein n=1 Tax=Vecturithrix granuli TaxID=1499967 RepID=A0A081C9Z9_VECG1|nr:hypothetical protein U27_01304 [Candidatus Vecturithrix granuli]